MKRLFFTSAIILAFSSIYCQKEYARTVLDTLCSPAMHGRGYYQKGDSIAAGFIKAEYKKMGLLPVNDTYFQSFKMSINSVDGKLNVKVDSTKKLIPGVDYLVAPSCPSVNAVYECCRIYKKEILDVNLLKSRFHSMKDKMIVIDKTEFDEETPENKKQLQKIIGLFKYYPDTQIKGLIELTSENLIYSCSQTQSNRPNLLIKKETVPEAFKTISLNIESTYHHEYNTQNVIGKIEGKSDSVIAITAHYDHIGRMGNEIYFPGANDNASGVATLLTLAKHYATKKPKYTLVFFAFSGEEAGLLGSKHYTQHPLFPLGKIKFLLNFDIMGTGDDGVQVVNGSIYKEEFQKLVAINDQKKLLKQVKIRGERCNSDHCHFYEKGVPSFFTYTLGGIAHYHNIHDKASTLPLTEFDDVVKLYTKFIDSFSFN